MQTLSLIEGHPVLDLGRVFFLALAAFEDRGALLERKGEHADRRILVKCRVAGHNVALNKELTVDVIPHVLGTDADLDVSACHVICAAAAQEERISPGTENLVDRLPLDRLSGKDILDQLSRFQVLQNGVAVLIQSGRECHGSAPARGEHPLHIAGLILFSQLADVFCDFIFLD